MWTFVVLGENGVAVARALTSAEKCPQIELDGLDATMDVRVAAGTERLRPTRSAPADSKPASFPILVCEKNIPGRTRRASIAGRELPLPPNKVERIVVIGDTGCRLKSGEEFQSCSDAQKYQFARIAESAARWKPDLVVHVGDYLYRENVCPPVDQGCAGSPWGYGWDAWRADLFDPGKLLLGAAPWVVIRGNHESCLRAGQGWWRFLDPRPLMAGRDCNDASQDEIGDYSDPYAVPIGDDAQLVVVDTSNTTAEPIASDTLRAARYRDAYRKLELLASRSSHTILANHQPILGLAGKLDKQGVLSVHASSSGISSVFASLDPSILPKQVQFMLSGHTHLWEALAFSSPHPIQFIAGFSGTLEDVVPMPETLTANTSPAPGAIASVLSSWVYGFGFMTMERAGGDRWSVAVWDAMGKKVNDCEVKGRALNCRFARID